MKAILRSGLLLLAVSVSASAAGPTQFFKTYCFDCHDNASQEAEIDLERMPADWARHETVTQWQRVLDVIQRGEMPPKAETQPPDAERRAAVESLKTLLTEKSPVGGTGLQRLNRVQYENSIQRALGLPFRTPASFPADTSQHGFDNVSEGLVISPPLMEQYLEVATAVADELFPPARPDELPQPVVTALKPADFSQSFEGSKLHGEGDEQRLRLVSKNEVLIRSSTWPTRFEARYSGTYEVVVRLSAFKPKGNQTLQVRMLAIRTGDQFVSVFDRRKLGVFEVRPDEKRHEFNVTVTLNRGETIAFYWANSPFGWNRDGRDVAAAQLRARLKDKAIHAAWKKIGNVRGRSAAESWRLMREQMASGELDLSDPELDGPPTRFPATVQNELMWIFENMHHERGPALDLHSATVRGPIKLIEDRDMKSQRLRTARMIGDRNGRTDEQWASAVLEPLLSKLFRRPVSEERLAKYSMLAVQHAEQRGRFEDGVHLAIRAALTSPDFLYLSKKPGRLDDFDLASRLSYFLTSAPPDARLFKLAGDGKLSEPETLEAETRRLLASRGSAEFIENFTGQWLGTRLLQDIMPDPRLMKFLDRDRQSMIAETEMFFGEILHRNLPLDTFIAPDFTFMNARLASRIYDVEFPGKAKAGQRKAKDELQRVALPRDGRVGGILGQASVMMATANGVDTQPVLRGVWLLENVFGTPPPPPPKSVPAIPPDTNGTSSIRQRLNAHRQDRSCSRCHAKIDPLGFVLESFDPIGRWRSRYPVYADGAEDRPVAQGGVPVDPSAVLIDGTRIADVRDLKRYLVEHIDEFSRCLTGKLMTYATGRPMSYGDRQVIERIVNDVARQGNGFADLIVAIVQSDSFQTR